MPTITSSDLKGGAVEGAIVAVTEEGVDLAELSYKLAKFEVLFDLPDDDDASPAVVHTFEISFQPADGDFDYPGGTPDQGELPTDDVGAIIVRDLDAGGTATIDDVPPMTVAEWIAFGSAGALQKAIYGGDDLLTYSDTTDDLRGYAGDDTIRSGAGDDTLAGDGGGDLLSGDAGRDSLLGGGGADDLFGGDDADRLRGGGGNDVLNGGTGADALSGDGGADTLAGGQGADELTGGKGADRFAYAMLASALESGPTAKTRDTIEDFQRGPDRIDFSRLPINDSLDGTYTFIGKAGFDEAGQVRYQTVKDGVVVFANMDDDAAPELGIFLDGVKSLSTEDFMF